MKPWRHAQWVSFTPSARAYWAACQTVPPSLKLRRPTKALAEVGAKGGQAPGLRSLMGQYGGVG